MSVATPITVPRAPPGDPAVLIVPRIKATPLTVHSSSSGSCNWRTGELQGFIIEFRIVGVEILAFSTTAIVH